MSDEPTRTLCVTRYIDGSAVGRKYVPVQELEYEATTTPAPGIGAKIDGRVVAVRCIGADSELYAREGDTEVKGIVDPSEEFARMHAVAGPEAVKPLVADYLRRRMSKASEGIEALREKIFLCIGRMYGKMVDSRRLIAAATPSSEDVFAPYMTNTELEPVDGPPTLEDLADAKAFMVSYDEVHKALALLLKSLPGTIPPVKVEYSLGNSTSMCCECRLVACFSDYLPWQVRTKWTMRTSGQTKEKQ
jgi:hypothetical protein